MTNLIRFAPAALLVVYLAVKLAPHIQSVKPDGGYEPTDSQKELLAPVSDALAGNPSAAKNFEDLYYGMALVVGTDRVILKTTDDVRRAHENAGAIAIQAGEIARIPGYAKAVNDFLSEQIGTDNIPLDDEKRKQIIDAFKALAWATN